MTLCGDTNDEGGTMRRLVAVVACAVVVAGLGSAPGWAQEPQLIEIPVDTVVEGAPGSEHQVATAAVAPEDQGRECTVAAEGVNNESAHPDTDLLVRSGGGEVVAPDVEREPEAHTEASGTLVLGSEVTVFVRLGPDGIFSGGMVVTVECAPLPTSTTTTVTTPPAPEAPPAVPVPAEPDFTG
jgi:hypothetical protein